MSKEIELYSNKFEESEDSRKLLTFSKSLEEEYIDGLNKLKEINRIFKSNDLINVASERIFNSKLFDYNFFIINLKTKIWNKVIYKDFIYKYISEKQLNQLIGKLGIIHGSGKIEDERVCLEPTSENIYKMLKYFILNKKNFINENLFRRINENAFEVERKHNKPSEFTEYVILDSISDYSTDFLFSDNQNNCELHKAFCAFLDVEYNENNSINSICRKAHLQLPDKKYTNTTLYEKIKKKLLQEENLNIHICLV